MGFVSFMGELKDVLHDKFDRARFNSISKKRQEINWSTFPDRIQDIAKAIYSAHAFSALQGQFDSKAFKNFLNIAEIDAAQIYHHSMYFEHVNRASQTVQMIEGGWPFYKIQMEELLTEFKDWKTQQDRTFRIGPSSVPLCPRRP